MRDHDSLPSPPDPTAAAASGRLATALADRYRIERELGAGGMATVFLARDLRHEREVAIKVLRPELGTAIGAQRFLAEIRTTARLQHPHILPLLDSGDAGDGLLYYVMPFVRGESLRQRLERERQLPIDDALGIAREVADALQHAHGLGVIHRDIKPENILLQDGHALVADFGIALALQHSGGQRMTQTGMSLGTPHYMSPEQAMGERTLDARTDVYALGAVTYEMLAGQPPFTGATAQAIVAQVIAAPPHPPSRFRDTVPPEAEGAVLRALAKLPADRWPSTKAFADALARGDGNGTGLTRASVATRSMPGTWRDAWRRWGLAGAAAVLGALAMAAAMQGGGTGAGAHPAGGTGITVRTVVAQPDSEALAPALPFPAMALSPSGDRLFYVRAVPGGTMQLRVRHWDRLHSEALPRAVVDACCLAVSPTGDSVAYLAGTGRFEVQALAGGAPRVLADSALGTVTTTGGGIDWAGDGMLYVGAREGLLRVDPRTDTQVLVARIDRARGDRLLLWPSVLPGGKAALVTIVTRNVLDRTESRIGIADFATGTVELVEAGMRAIYAPTGHLLVARGSGVLWAVPFDLATRRVTGRGIELGDTLYTRAAAFNMGSVDLALAPDGTLTYLAGDEGRFQLVTVDRGGTARPLADQFDMVTFNGMSLSRDGRRLAIVAVGSDYRSGLWLVPLDGSPATRLDVGVGGPVRPRWRPGTDSLTYSFILDSAVTRWRLRTGSSGGGGGSTPFRIGEERGVGGHAWSSEGRWLLIRTEDQSEGHGDILALRPGIDTTPSPLIATPAEELAPELSPDGRWLAYSSDESGRREVYVRPFPDVNASRVQVSQGGGITPVWSRDGRELFFVDGQRRMSAVFVTPGATLRVSAPVPLFPLDGYRLTPWQAMFEVTADGRFIMARQLRRTELRVVVVTRFLDELARRAAAAR
jgi:hypothetical protein